MTMKILLLKFVGKLLTYEMNTRLTSRCISMTMKQAMRIILLKLFDIGNEHKADIKVEAENDNADENDNSAENNNADENENDNG